MFGLLSFLVHLCRYFCQQSWGFFSEYRHRFFANALAGLGCAYLVLVVPQESVRATVETAGCARCSADGFLWKDKPSVRTRHFVPYFSPRWK